MYFIDLKRVSAVAFFKKWVIIFFVGLFITLGRIILLFAIAYKNHE